MAPRKRSELIAAQAWEVFYRGAGRSAVAALFTEFGLYDRLGSNDPNEALRREGQRDVLLRIVQLIGLKPDMAVDDAWGHADAYDRLTRS